MNAGRLRRSTDRRERAATRGRGAVAGAILGWVVTGAMVLSACASEPDATLPTQSTTTESLPPTPSPGGPRSKSSRPTEPTPSSRPTGGVSSSTAAATARRPVAVLVGDSMVREARFALAERAPAAGFDLRVIDRGQGAPCNQLDQVLTELGRAPDLLVIEWVGNARFTVPCTNTFTPDEVVAEYRVALDRVIAARPPATTIALVGVPPIILQPWSTTWAPLDALYRALAAADPHVAFIDTGSVIAPSGRFARTLACTKADESSKVCGTRGAAPGQVVIRDPLGFHFCPVKYDFGTMDCPVPNPGADRYAQAILDGLTALVQAGTGTSSVG